MFIEDLEKYDLDNKERGLLLYLIKYIPYGNNYLRHKNGKEITADELAINSSLSKPTFLKTIKSLEDKNIIKKIRYKNKIKYFVNPSIVLRGSRPLEFVVTLFSGKQ